MKEATRGKAEQSGAKNPWIKNEQWTEEIGLLRAIVQKTELVETTKWGGEVYTINNKNVLGIGGFKNYFTLWFWNGVFLKDEAKVLVNANEGVTKALRQWRFTSATEIDEKLILRYINEAIANEKAGLAIKPEKKEALPCAFFQAALDKNKTLKTAFEKFTPGKQKGVLGIHGNCQTRENQSHAVRENHADDYGRSRFE